MRVRSKKASRIIRRFRRLFVAVGILLILWLIAVGSAVVLFGRIDSQGLVRRQPSSILVLGAAVESDGTPSPVFEARLRHAIELFDAGLAPTIVFTGGRGAGDRLSEAEAARRFAIRNGVPQQMILVETSSRTTRQNLAQASAVMRDAGVGPSIILVTDPYHQLRATWMAHDEGFGVFPSPAAGTRYRTWRSKVPFLLREIYFLHHYFFTGQ